MRQRSRRAPPPPTRYSPLSATERTSSRRRMHCYGTRVILSDLLEPWGLRATFVDMADVEAVRDALTPETKLVWIESPGNPMLDVAPIPAIAAVAQAAGIVTACDNTLATPVFQRPFECGVDLAIHATTKYLGGHSDVIGGAVVAPIVLFDRIRHIQHAAGAVPSPFECWLVQRGIRTLPYRMRAHAANATAVADFLRDHANVEAVHYPGFGGVLSFQVRGGESSHGVAARVPVVHASDELRRSGEPYRAPRVGGRAGHENPA